MKLKLRNHGQFLFQLQRHKRITARNDHPRLLSYSEKSNLFVNINNKCMKTS